MSNNFLVAPIHIEALYVQGESGYLAVEPMANFRHLPYCDRAYTSTGQTQYPQLSEAKGRDVHSATPYISENIVSPPFQNRNLHLAPGIHLHWQLPKALKTGRQKNKELSFPTIPNRWLIIRKQGQRVESEWIVESDYIWSEIAADIDGNPLPKSVCIPYQPDPTKGEYQPYRYLGRQMLLADWLADHSSSQYWGKSLTAIGYGEPAFSAFYPNCYSVLGCYDSKVAKLSNLCYEVIGWHSNKEFDYIRSLILEYSPNSQQSLTEFVQNQAKWSFLDNLESVQETVQTLYYGCLEFSHADVAQNTLDELNHVILANSGTEALSTFIAHQVSQQDKALSKLDIENQLEALQLLNVLGKEQGDLDKKLREARHEKGFVAHASGTLWQIEQDEQPQSNYLPNKTSQTTPSQLPVTLAEQLNQLNKLQTAYNTAHHQIESKRQQIFADWYKYLICLHPPVDDLDRYPQPELVQSFLANVEIQHLQQRESEAKQIKTQLETQLKEVSNSLELFNDSLNNNSESQAQLREYKLKPVPAPRYWQPNEPVVMIVLNSEKETTPEVSDPGVSESQTQDAGMCFMLSLKEDITGKAIYSQLADRLREMLQESADRKAVFTRVWRSQPWKPFLLEWEVQLTSIRSQRNYLSDFINRYYGTDPALIDFQLQTSNAVQPKDAEKNVYSGRSFLTEYAADQHKQQIEAFLMQSAYFQKFCKDRSIQSVRGCLAQHLDAYQEWITQADIPAPQKQFFDRLLAIYKNFRGMKCISQTLNGFNQALLGRKQTLQLPIDDPISFEQNQSFVELVRDAVQDSIISAPQPLNFFNPIRSGSLKILRLRLVDTFGQVRDLQWDQVLTPEHLKTNQDNAVVLPPRIVQPARLHFRWLSGNSHPVNEEASSHPALNPICGWLLPDRIDQTIEVYNTEGHSLGELEINKAGRQRWRSAPSSRFAVDFIDDIPNPHLQRVIRYLDDNDDAFLEDFVQSLTQAWEQIDPDVTDTDPSLSLLMGQPIAVVRACLNLQLQGLPAINQDWAVFKRDVQQFKNTRHQSIDREVNGFMNVQFPILLGNHQSLSDGLVGYWRETQNGKSIELSEAVYIPLGSADRSQETVRSDSKRIIKQQEPFYQTLQSDPQFITALIDPRASIQVVSRILPTKSIQIPPEHYVDILKNLSVTFLVAPLLSSGTISVPLANALDCKWSWLKQQSPDQWLEVSSVGQIDRDRFIYHFEQLTLEVSSSELWNYLLQDEVAWLQGESGVTKCSVVPSEERKCKQLAKPYDRFQKSVDFLLDKLAIKVRPTTTDAAFLPQEIHEGWLKLKNLP